MASNASSAASASELMGLNLNEDLAEYMMEQDEFGETGGADAVKICALCGTTSGQPDPVNAGKTVMLSRRTCIATWST